MTDPNPSPDSLAYLQYTSGSTNDPKGVMIKHRNVLDNLRSIDLCLRKVSEEDRARLDLGSWRVAFNGAEPIRSDTLREFAATFSSVGFRASAFFPAYGLAEATLKVTCRKPDEPVSVKTILASALPRNLISE